MSFDTFLTIDVIGFIIYMFMIPSISKDSHNEDGKPFNYSHYMSLGLFVNFLILYIVYNLFF